jgi:hypothetical protein
MLSIREYDPHNAGKQTPLKDSFLTTDKVRNPMELYQIQIKELLKKHDRERNKDRLDSKSSRNEKGDKSDWNASRGHGSPVPDTRNEQLAISKPQLSTTPKYAAKVVVNKRVSSATTHNDQLENIQKLKAQSSVQKILEGLKVNRLDLGELVKQPQNGAVKKETITPSTSAMFQKKHSAQIVFGNEPSRENSRKSSAGRKKSASPPQHHNVAGDKLLAHTSIPHTSQNQNQHILSQPLNIKIENKDFIAKLMNINIIKIRPDLKKNQCYCKTTASAIRKKLERNSKEKKSGGGKATSSSAENRGKVHNPILNAFMRNKSTGASDENLFRKTAESAEPTTARDIGTGSKKSSKTGSQLK